MMMNNKAFRSLFACLIALLLAVTLIPFAAFAAEDEAPDATVGESVADDATADDATADDATAEDAAADDATAEDTAEEDGATDSADDTATEDDETEEEPEEKNLGVGFWVSMGVLGVLIIVGVVFAIIKRAKLKVWWGSIKSELKKIVWSSPEQVKKNSIVVIVFVVALAVAIGLLDFVFFRGIGALSDLL